jgi:hypothetical protein
MFIIALIAAVLAFIQNIVIFSFGMKEMALFSSPLSFTGIFLAEIAAIWTGYVSARRFVRRRRMLALAAWVIAVLGSSELALPVSSFTTLVQQAGRQRVLNRIELAGASFEALASDRGGIRFGLDLHPQISQDRALPDLPGLDGAAGQPGVRGLLHQGAS